jgi:hypothetical protein
MNLEEAINNILDTTLDENNDWYKWREIDETLLPPGIILPKGNQYIKNVMLKKELNKKWQNASDHEERKQLTKYYIETWGGIHSNSEDTLDTYVRSSPDVIISRGSQGIASWSKALCVKNPNKYAIFDARVSASLNSLQLVNKVNDVVLFPVLTSRNKTIEKGNKLLKETGENLKWRNVSKNSFYREYLGQITKIAEERGIFIFTIEMLLFAKAEELIRQAFPDEKF